MAINKYFVVAFESKIIDTDEIYHDTVHHEREFKGWAKQKPEWIEKGRVYRVGEIENEVPGDHIFESPLDALGFQKKELEEALRKIKKDLAVVGSPHSDIFVDGE